MSGFSNPIINAGGTLIRTLMKSVNYVAGLAGWQITRDGDTEFNNGTFRGILKVTSSNGASIEIDASLPQPVINFYSPDHTNFAFINAPNYNNPQLADLGLNGGAYTPPDGIPRRGRLYFNDSSDITELGIMKTSNQSIRGGWLQLKSMQGLFGYRDIDAGFDQYLWMSNAPQITASHTMNLVSETWHNMNLLNGWINSGTTTPAQYRKVVAPCFSIQIAGEIRNGTTTNGTVIANLPVGYRPTTRTVTIPIASLSSPAAGAAGPFLQLFSNGDLQIWGAAGGVVEYFNAVVPLDLI